MRSPDPSVAVDLASFIAASPSPYHAALEVARRLADAGFVGVTLTDSWRDLPSHGFCLRGGAIVAWAMPNTRAFPPPSTGFHMIGAHTDSPNLRLKPQADTGAAGWRQLAVEVYGGALLNSWLDRDLGLSGRVALTDGSTRMLAIDRPLARVPQLAIHLDRDVNDRGLQLDKQAHLTPVWGLGPIRVGEFIEFVAGELSVAPATVAAYDLMFHDLTPPALLGRDGDLLAAPRLDNLCSCHAAVTALLQSADQLSGPAVIALFDHEEVGSESTTGAAGPLLETVLHRVIGALHGDADDLARSLGSSACISSDMAHAVHPNYPERHEPGHRPVPNGGPALKQNANARYATDARTAARFLDACQRADVPVQYFVSRNNLPCGSTIGPITATRLGIDTVDVGCPQLSMHSARELMGAHDPGYLVAAMEAFLVG
jgi:aspartyl aminopeptidase